MMLNPIRVEAHAFDLRPGPAIVRGIDRIIQYKFGPALSSVDLDW
jgi:hypothetical protein